MSIAPAMLLPMAFGLTGALAGSALMKKPKAPDPAQTVAIPRPITPNQAVEASMQDDERRRRRGMGANILLGAQGAEAQTPGGKVLLGQ